MGLTAAFLAAAILGAAGIAFYFGTYSGAYSATTVHAAEGSRTSAKPISAAQNTIASQSMLKSLPMFFEPNQGQTDPPVKFLARGSGYGLFLTSDEAVLQLQPPAASAISHQLLRSVIRMRLDGANSSPRISGSEPLLGKSNYFIGNDRSKWRRNIPHFARVEYSSVYPGVDLVYYGNENEGKLEYDFRVAPAADPNQIALTFQGASARISARIDDGDLILSTDGGDVRFHAPHVYQPAVSESRTSSAEAEKTISGSFRLLAANKIGFSIGDYDHSRELVIDPVLSYSTYLGGSGTEGGLVGTSPENLVKFAVDSGDQIYVAGSTNSAFTSTSRHPNPDNPPPIQSTLAGTQNIFIAVLNPNQNVPASQQLVFATYIGGSQIDFAGGIAVSTDEIRDRWHRHLYCRNHHIVRIFPATGNCSFPATGCSYREPTDF